MGKFLSLAKQKEILDSAPPQVNKDKLVKTLINGGYELEGINSKFSFGEAANNFAPDVVEVGKQIYSTIANPGQTAEGIASVGLGGLRKVIGRDFNLQIPTMDQGDQQGTVSFKADKNDEQTFNALKDALYEQYGSWEKIKNTAEKQPAQFLSDVSIILNPATGALKSALSGTKAAKYGEWANRLSRTLETTTMAREAAGIALKPFANVLKNKFTEMLGATSAQIRDLSKSTRIFPKDPTNWLIEHGIAPTAGLKNMSNKLDDIYKATYGRLDEVLEKVPETFKHADTQSLLNELEKYYSRKGSAVKVPDLKNTNEAIFLGEQIKNNPASIEKIKKYRDDISSKIQELKGSGKYDEMGTLSQKMSLYREAIEIAEGKGSMVEAGIPVKPTKIPLEKEKISIPKENLSEADLAQRARIIELSNKNKEVGLTLSEINEAKRLSDDVFAIYNKAGDAKGTGKAKQLGNLRMSTRKFIEDTADKYSGQYGKDLKDVYALNQQTQYAHGWKNIIDETRLVGAKRNGVFESILGAGAFSSMVFGDVEKAAYFGAGIGALELTRLPRLRSFVLTKLGLMSNGEYKRLLGDVQTLSKGQEVGQELRRFRQEAMRYLRYGDEYFGSFVDEKPKGNINFEVGKIPVKFNTTQQDKVKQ